MIGPTGWRKYAWIGVGATLMFATVFVAGEALLESNESAILPLTGVGDTPSIPTESGVFRLAKIALHYRDSPAAPESRRSLDSFYARRAYPGAPPVIPHAIADPTSFGGRTCLACHGDGGWAPAFGAYAPVTPHPDFGNCVQCHVASSDVAPFRATTFQPVERPQIHRTAMPGSPPQIPHDLFMRDNCLACHAGPGAVREIRTTHPERVNCRQCHAQGSTPTAGFARPVREQP